MFRSGKVKLRVGDVLMDVSLGLPNQHRQDVSGGGGRGQGGFAEEEGACEGQHVSGGTGKGENCRTPLQLPGTLLP